MSNISQGSNYQEARDSVEREIDELLQCLLDEKVRLVDNINYLEKEQMKRQFSNLMITDDEIFVEWGFDKKELISKIHQSTITKNETCLNKSRISEAECPIDAEIRAVTDSESLQSRDCVPKESRRGARSDRRSRRGRCIRDVKIPSDRDTSDFVYPMTFPRRDRYASNRTNAYNSSPMDPYNSNLIHSMKFTPRIPDTSNWANATPFFPRELDASDRTNRNSFSLKESGTSNQTNEIPFSPREPDTSNQTNEIPFSPREPDTNGRTNENHFSPREPDTINSGSGGTMYPEVSIAPPQDLHPTLGVQDSSLDESTESETPSEPPDSQSLCTLI